VRVIMIIVGLLVIAISCGLAFRYGRYATNARADLEQERYLRMVAEENVQAFHAKLETLEAELKRSQNKIKAVEKVAEQNQAINVDLKSRLDKILEIKDRLEAKIKELEHLSSTKDFCAISGAA